MENTKSKKWNFAHLCAYLSLVISIIILILWCCNAGGFTVVSLDSFVGVIVALLAIIVTFIVGWQIYNGIELKAKIEELCVLKEKLEIQEKESAKNAKQLSHLIFGGMADNEISNGNYTLAFLYLMRSLGYSMSLDVPENIDVLFDRLSQSIDQIQKDTICSNMEKIHDLDKKIRLSKNYSLIKEQYEKIYNGFIDKVKVNEE